LSDENARPPEIADGRTAFEWDSKYDDKARKRMAKEAIYIAAVFILSFVLLFLNYRGVLSRWLSRDEETLLTIEYIAYFSIAGLLGGNVFGIKFFYRAVARGSWHMDRIYWRIFSPFVSMAVALIVGVMISTGILAVHNDTTNLWAIAFGFFAGYFADEAVGKMYDIATLLFGKTKQM